jgi:hypothetical protein
VVDSKSTAGLLLETLIVAYVGDKFYGNRDFFCLLSKQRATRKYPELDESNLLFHMPFFSGYIFDVFFNHLHLSLSTGLSAIPTKLL